MDFRQCVLIFEKYPSLDSWKTFFEVHIPFWEYFIKTAPGVFPVNIMYPSKSSDNWNWESYQSHSQALLKMEDFFALYFLIIIFHHDQEIEESNFSREQELWKHMWDREYWYGRVQEAVLVSSLQNLKNQLQNADAVTVSISKNTSMSC